MLQLRTQTHLIFSNLINVLFELGMHAYLLFTNVIQSDLYRCGETWLHAKNLKIVADEGVFYRTNILYFVWHRTVSCHLQSSGTCSEIHSFPFTDCSFGAIHQSLPLSRKHPFANARLSFCPSVSNRLCTLWWHMSRRLAISKEGMDQI